MSSSDWLAVVLTLAGIIGGAAVSWILFRTQLIADFNSLRTIILEQIKGLQIAHTEISNKLDISEKLEKREDIISIGETVDRIDRQLRDAVRSVVADVKEQHAELAARIQQQFLLQSDLVTKVVKDAFATEIRSYVQDAKAQDRLLRNLLGSFAEGLRTMGEYQKANIAELSNVSLTEIERIIVGSIDPIRVEVVELKDSLPQLAAEKPKRPRSPNSSPPKK